MAAGEPIDGVTAGAVVNAMTRGDTDAIAVWNEAMDRIGSVLAATIAALDPGVVVVGGGLSRAGAALTDPLTAAIGTYLPWRSVPPVVRARFVDDAGFIGCAIRAWRRRRRSGRRRPRWRAGPRLVALRSGVLTMAALVVGGRVVMPDGAVDSGFVEVDGGRIVGAGHGGPPAAAVSHADWTIVPGFVDIHVHGGGGHTVTSGDPDAVAGSVAFHRGHGTTTTLVSLVTAPVDELVGASERIVAQLDDGAPALAAQVAGIHLEGPFLAAARCGAQNPAHMIDPSPDDVARLIAAGGGRLRVVTLAPDATARSLRSGSL